ncbi:MAG: hypothetical protein PHZ27_01085, partial [Candidatus Omnitrophica bacterium]|nr:hypothetical protein [Candidatus Omnitrophota bacterium]
MRKFFVLISVLAVITAGSVFAQADDFYIYADKNSPENHFIPSGWMGDTGDLKMNDQSQKDPHSGTTALEIGYTAKKSGGNGWAGITWQSAQNNWGQKDSGFDLSGFNKLSFWAKGANGGEVVTVAKVGGIISKPDGSSVDFPDTLNVEYKDPIRLTDQWQEYYINLSGEDLAYVNGGFSIVFNADHSGVDGQTVYLDDIKFSYDESLGIEETGSNFPFYVYADSTSLDNHFIPSGFMPATAARDIKLDTRWQNLPFSGDTCIRVQYENVSGTRWAGVYWQTPANNWGSVANAGFNLQGATKLTFWARGDKGGEIVT